MSYDLYNQVMVYFSNAFNEGTWASNSVMFALFSSLIIGSTNINKLNFSKRYTNANLKIFQYLCPHLKNLISLYVEDFILKHFLHFEIYTREIYEMFVYKYTKTIE